MPPRRKSASTRPQGATIPGVPVTYVCCWLSSMWGVLRTPHAPRERGLAGYLTTVRRYTVVWRYVWPGRRTTEGHSGRFGESG
jgi:hypothetical protein